MTIQIIGVIALLCISLLIRRRKQAWKNIASYILPVGCLLVLVNLLLAAPFTLGLGYGLRIVLLITPMVIVIHTGSSSDFSVAFRTLPIHPRLHYLFIFSFEIVQSLREVFHAVHIAQQLRGYHVERAFHRRWKNILPLLLPVTLIGISQSLDRSLSYEFKGIESGKAKTYLRTLPLSTRDKTTIALLLFLSLILILMRIVFR